MKRNNNNTKNSLLPDYTFLIAIIVEGVMAQSTPSLLPFGAKKAVICAEKNDLNESKATF